MIGAKTLIERYGAEPIEFDEEDDNVKGVTWHMKVYWDPKAPGVLCTEKISPKQNGGRPITIRRWVDATGLNVSQEWAPGKVFTQRCDRARADGLNEGFKNICKANAILHVFSMKGMPGVSGGKRMHHISLHPAPPYRVAARAGR